MSEGPGISQHSHHLARGCSLVDRIDAGRPAGFDAPPQRRWRLVLDLGADDVVALRMALDSIDAALAKRERQDPDPTGCVVGGTSGGASAGYHWELVERPGCDHDSFIAELTGWLETRRSEP